MKNIDCPVKATCFKSISKLLKEGLSYGADYANVFLGFLSPNNFQYCWPGRYVRGVFEIQCKFLRKHRKRKDSKRLFDKMSPTWIYFWWRLYSFWSALVKSSLMMVGTTPFNLVSPVCLILPAMYFENPVESHNPHGVRFPFLQLIGKYWKSWKCWIFPPNL